MECYRVQEQLIDLLYDEDNADRELVEHVKSCPACREELTELRQTRSILKMWKDEEPLRHVEIPGLKPARAEKRLPLWYLVRYAGIAAMIALTLLAVVNTEITWNPQGFSFRTHLFSKDSAYYSKAETRELLKMVLDDSESRITETNYLMMQRMLDTIEQDRVGDLRLIEARWERLRNKN